ncbi:SseB family protein [Streptomyces cinerochromogenes]|uniref:SseB family protein n=1 Tax=Streptomyces cinerochromogenes TaxID=66422 RepID=UPI0033B18B7C
MRDGTALAEQIAERRAGMGDPRALLGELRRASVLVPLDRGGLWTGRFGGVRWVFAFTGEEALARFAQERARESGSAQDSARPWEFAELLGARLLDEVIPAMGEPAGIAVDVADPYGAMLFPPALGIVPEEAAVDAPARPVGGTEATGATGATAGGAV